MKYIVEVKYTNPSHEHVSLRRRVDSINRLIEAKTPEEALNRAANIQRALGFSIQSANIVEQKVEISEPIKTEPADLSEAVDYKALEKPTIMRIKSGETKPVDRTNYNIPTYLRKKANEKKPVDKKAALEAYIARKKETSVVTEEAADAAPQYIEEKLSASDPTSKWISDFVASDNPKFAGKSKKERIRMALGAKYAAMRNEEVEQVDEVTGYEGVKDRTDMIKRAAAMNRMGKGVFLSKVKARAAEMKKEKAEKELAKEETEVVEAADPGSMKVVNKKVEAQAVKDTKNSEKKVKATEKAVQLAKNKKNPVNLKPVLGGDKVKNA